MYLTIIVTLGAFVLSKILGLVLAFMGVNGICSLSAISRVFMFVVEGIPGLVTLFCIYFVFPDLGLSLTAVQAAIRKTSRSPDVGQ
ncbi:ABC transporter permease subunit [Phyllobacterium phragmitis]|uniref:ABC transporter permease subunit n=1 Tax=Phyllobacterium phragmitis TaxID=2670329 RepID=UPI001FE21CD5|nr:ABC transporter permease subunit [Phyllobacterium phragmitis]